MANIYEYLDYRQFIHKSAREQHFSSKSLGQECRIHPSYFSRVMVNKAGFSQSQLFAIGRALKLTSHALEYLLLLGSLDSAATQDEKNHFKARIRDLQHRENQVIKQMDEMDNLEAREKAAELYYQEAITAQIHMHLTIDRYRLNPDALQKKLQISPQKLERELDKLEKLKLIERTKNQIRIIKDEVHLDEASPLSTSNHINWRLETIANLQNRDGSPTDYHVSVVFSADEETKFQLKQLYKNFLIQAQKAVSKCAKTTEVYHLHFDLFE